MIGVGLLCKCLTGPTMSETCETVVPDAAPRYSTLDPGFMCILSTPPNIAAASLLRNGFHTRYSIFSPSGCVCVCLCLFVCVCVMWCVCVCVYFKAW